MKSAMQFVANKGQFDNRIIQKRWTHSSPHAHPYKEFSIASVAEDSVIFLRQAVLWVVGWYSTCLWLVWAVFTTSIPESLKAFQITQAATSNWWTPPRWNLHLDVLCSFFVSCFFCWNAFHILPQRLTCFCPLEYCNIDYQTFQLWVSPSELNMFCCFQSPGQTWINGECVGCGAGTIVLWVSFGLPLPRDNETTRRTSVEIEVSLKHSMKFQRMEWFPAWHECFAEVLLSIIYKHSLMADSQKYWTVPCVTSASFHAGKAVHDCISNDQLKLPLLVQCLYIVSFVHLCFES